MNSRKDESVRYLSVSDLYNINFTVTEGDTFVRDIHLLESAAKRPAIVVFGHEQFSSIAEKAAALMQSLAYHHLFADGNKRTAIKAVEIFLDKNDYVFHWQPGEIESFVLEVAQDHHSINEISQWLTERIASKND